MAVVNVNGKSLQANADPRTPLLWVLRDTLGMTGTKYGCGIAQCGACTVLIDGVATRSCQVPLNSVGNRKVTTIDEDALREEVAEHMKRFIPEYEDIVKKRAVALPYLKDAHDKVWGTPLKFSRFLTRTRYGDGGQV